MIEPGQVWDMGGRVILILRDPPSVVWGEDTYDSLVLASDDPDVLPGKIHAWHVDCFIDTRRLT